MILKLIHNNKIGAYALMLLSLILLWINPVVVGDVPDMKLPLMPLWKLFSLAQSSLWISISLSFVSAVIITLNITRFNSNYALLSKQSALPGFIFIILVSSLTYVQHFSPIWISTIFFIISMDYLFHAYGKRKTMNDCFMATLWLSFATMFSYKIILIIPLIFFIMSILRVLSFKAVLASLIGLILPWLFVYGYTLFFDETSTFYSYFEFSPERIFNLYSHNMASILFFGILILIFIAALLSVFNEYGKKKIFTRKQYQVFVFSGIYLTALMILTGTSMDLLPIVAVPTSIIIAHLLDHIRSWIWQNVIVISLFITIILGQLFVL